MKTKPLFTVLAISLMLFGCTKDSDVFTENVETTMSEPEYENVKVGTISLTPFVKEEIQSKTGKPPTLDEVLDNMVVEIVDFENNIILSDNYRDLPEFIELAPGSYRFFMDNWPWLSARFDTPVYGTSTLNFNVTSGENTVVNVALRLFDVAVTIDLSDEVKTNYPDLTVTTSVVNYYLGGSNFLSWTIADDARTGYFDLVEENFPSFGDIGTTKGDMTITIEAQGNAGVPIIVSKTYPGVLANEHYIITIEQSSASSFSLNITLNDEVIVDDIITFPN
ncbi:MAG: DUF4493 domain-containing protein [Flavobacteriaceae bacterium]